MPIKRITYNKLRALRDALPDGALHRIAHDLNMDIDVVRSYFGCYDLIKGAPAGFHVEPGPDGGIVLVDDTKVLDYALQMLHDFSNPTKY